MTAKEWLGVMQQAEDYNSAMTNLIEKYGELLAKQEAIGFAEWVTKHFHEEQLPSNEWVYSPSAHASKLFGLHMNIIYTTDQLYQIYQTTKQK